MRVAASDSRQGERPSSSPPPNDSVTNVSRTARVTPTAGRRGAYTSSSRIRVLSVCAETETKAGMSSLSLMCSAMVTASSSLNWFLSPTPHSSAAVVTISRACRVPTLSLNASTSAPDRTVISGREQ